MSRFFPRKTNFREHKRKRQWRWGAIFIGAFLLLAIAFYVLAGRTGHWLVQNDSFEHVRWAVILDGQGADLERNDFAANLLHKQQADTLIVLGRRLFRDRNALDFYVPDLLRQGNIDPHRIFVLRHDDPSTIEEAYSLIPALKLRGADTVLLITSTASSHRAAMIFNHLAQGEPFFIACDIGYFDYRPETWIHTRESRKIWLREWAALIYAKLELFFAEPALVEEGKTYKLELWEQPASVPLPKPIVKPAPVLVPIDSNQTDSLSKKS